MPIVPYAAESPDALSAASGTTILYKHSPTCELSQWAARELARLVDEDDVTIHQVDVLQQRPLSRAIETHFGVRHESPQLLIIEDGTVAWHGSHRALSADRVRSVIAGAREGVGARW